MPSFAFSIPVLEGKEELDRMTLDEMLVERRDEYEAALRDAALTGHGAWRQRPPNGRVAVVCAEGRHQRRPSTGSGASDAPLSVWFRDRVKDVRGVDTSPAKVRATK